MVKARRRRLNRMSIAPLAAALVLTSCSGGGGNDAAGGNLNCQHRATVSGVAPPPAVDNIWQSVFIDDFNRCELGENWTAYTGRPDGDKYGKWHPSMVSIDNGVLRLHSRRDGDEWQIGGVSNWPVTQKYGRWEVRYKVEPSADISYHFLLWPQNEQWPPEIDFAEDVSSGRDGITGFLHWRDGKVNRKANAHIAGDFTEWHTVGVEWAPGVVRYLLDGEVWAISRSAEHVPITPMWMGLQMGAGACEIREEWGKHPCAATEPRPLESSIDIDWVAVYDVMGSYSALAKSGYFDTAPEASELTEP
ncbi:MAG: glycoside hydrolase family 16 protein [Gordonia sp.]|nr:glycoside hydrolase family 16 protein [Gordonia sp. (in: high G+C Gram-positive bacteria)]